MAGEVKLWSCRTDVEVAPEVPGLLLSAELEIAAGAAVPAANPAAKSPYGTMYISGFKGNCNGVSG
jgi:hypothetical protein